MEEEEAEEEEEDLEEEDDDDDRSLSSFSPVENGLRCFFGLSFLLSSTLSFTGYTRTLPKGICCSVCGIVTDGEAQSRTEILRVTVCGTGVSPVSSAVAPVVDREPPQEKREEKEAKMRRGNEGFFALTTESA